MSDEMNEQRAMLADSVNRLFREASAPAAAEDWNAALWQQVEEIGLPLLLAPEDAGGVGGNWEDAFVVLHSLGYYTVALPVAEAMLAARLLAGAGIELPAGPLTVAPMTEGQLENGRFTGKLSGVPWGAQADHIVAVVEQGGQHFVVLLPRAEAASSHETKNLAAEPRATLSFEAAAVAAAPGTQQEALRLFDYCALLRVGQIAGALESALVRTIGYAKERTQFGKPIGNFQAVQQQLALFGNEAAATACAARVALRAADRADAGFEIAAAKLRANLAINTGTTVAHQVHGAIGFTREYELRHATQRLWSWRTEFGNDRYWSSVLGKAVLDFAPDRFWAELTRRGDPVPAACD